MTAEDFIALPEETRRRLLKRLAYETVPEMEVKETADAPGVKVEPYTLYRMRDENQERYRLIDPRLVGIMHHRRDLRLLDFLEKLFGRKAFTLPTGLSSFSEINQQITAVLREVTEAVQTVLASVEPGSAGGVKITTQEMAAIEKEVDEGMAALVALKEAAKMVFGGKE